MKTDQTQKTDLIQWFELVKPEKVTWKNIADHLGHNCTESQIRKWFDGSRPNFEGYPGGKAGVIARLLELEQPLAAKLHLETIASRQCRPESTRSAPTSTNLQPLSEDIRIEDKLRFYSGSLEAFLLPRSVNFGGAQVRDGKLFVDGGDALRFLGYLIASEAAPGFQFYETHRDNEVRGRRRVNNPDWVVLEPADPTAESSLVKMAAWLQRRRRFHDSEHYPEKLKEHSGWRIALAVFYETQAIIKVRRGMAALSSVWESLRQTRSESIGDLCEFFQVVEPNQSGFDLASTARSLTDLPIHYAASGFAAALELCRFVGAYLRPGQAEAPTWETDR